MAEKVYVIGAEEKFDFGGGKLAKLCKDNSILIKCEQCPTQVWVSLKNTDKTAICFPCAFKMKKEKAGTQDEARFVLSSADMEEAIGSIVKSEKLNIEKIMELIITAKIKECSLNNVSPGEALLEIVDGLMFSTVKFMAELSASSHMSKEQFGSFIDKILKDVKFFSLEIFDKCVEKLKDFNKEDDNGKRI